MKKLCKYLSYGSLAAVILAMTAATFLEKLKGAETALDTVYHSAWFMVLWGIAAISGMVLLLSRGMSRKAFTVGMHVAFLLILAGALVTHLTGESGSLYLRTGEEATSYEKDNGETGFHRLLYRDEAAQVLQERSDPSPGRGASHHFDEPHPQEERIPLLSGGL